ncbi:MAG: tetratricopeptide repeat protein [Polyangiaceae bacterium]|nr:tetratricopeptide repeat protein [Polyangiaceae bacterium]
MMQRPWRRNSSNHVCRAIVVFVAVALLGGCGGAQTSTQAPSDPPPTLDADDTAAPSSSAVAKAMEAIKNEDFAAAQQALAAIATGPTDDAQAHYYLGVALEGLGKGSEAEAQYAYALAADPKLTEAALNLSAVLLDASKAKEALEVIDAALGDSPDSPMLLANKALALSMGSDTKLTLQAYEAAVAVAPGNHSLHFEYATMLARDGNKTAALTELDVATESDDIAVLASSADAYGKLKAFGKCIAALNRALAQKSGNTGLSSEQWAQLHLQRGMCEHGAKDDDSAAKDYRAAIQLNAKLAAAHYYLGLHLAKSGDKSAAKKSLEQAVALDASGRVGAAAAKVMKRL